MRDPLPAARALDTRGLTAGPIREAKLRTELAGVRRAEVGGREGRADGDDDPERRGRNGDVDLLLLAGMDHEAPARLDGAVGCLRLDRDIARPVRSTPCLATDRDRHLPGARRSGKAAVGRLLAAPAVRIEAIDRL